MSIKLPILRGPTRTILFLQNAWSPLYAGGTWPRRSWLKALERSRSGQRLRSLVDDYDQVENTTAIVGDTASSVVPPNEAYIVEILATRKPTVVIACGRQAEDALSGLWRGALLVVPHPACRVLTTALYEQGKKLAANMTTERIALRQMKGKFVTEYL